ncbi:MAG: metallophosphoesterase [Clostridia bacterium]|nr:metallophosphoesterase [Clostridia bacterium]
MKKFFKTVAKVIGAILGSVLSFLALCCVVTLIWGGVQASSGSVTDALPKTPADFTPEIRLIVFTDTHNENENVADAIDTAYTLFENDSVYPGVDAFFGLGDFSSIGTEPDYKAYVDTLHAHVREDTVCINVAGNHEFKADNYKQLFEQYFSHGLNTVTQINGFTCIAFSGERSLTEWTFTPKSLKWLSDEIHKAEDTAEKKPVFVFQHPHPFGTVYGSSIWCTPQLNPVFAGHSKVVNFSGHSHFPFNDPRSINQTSYTSVGVGAMARFELDENYIVGQHPEGYEEAAQFCVVEADSNGRVRVRGYDLLSDTFFCDYFIENVNDPDTFAYTYKNMKAHDTAPVFNKNAQAYAVLTENGDCRISFTEAEVPEGYIVHEYAVSIEDENQKEVYRDNFIAAYYIIDNDNMQGFTVAGDVIQPGKTYNLTVKAESAYHRYSAPVTLAFTVPEK